jgi:hypothetical protein
MQRDGMCVLYWRNIIYCSPIIVVLVTATTKQLGILILWRLLICEGGRASCRRFSHFRIWFFVLIDCSDVPIFSVTILFLYLGVIIAKLLVFKAEEAGSFLIFNYYQIAYTFCSINFQVCLEFSSHCYRFH